MVRKLITSLVLISAIILSFTVSPSGEELRDTLSTFMPPSCCYTNSCCWEITKDQLTQLSDGSWIVNSTQEHMPRAPLDGIPGSYFSDDGKYYRCACNLVGSEWIVDEFARTRCIGIPAQGF